MWKLPKLVEWTLSCSQQTCETVTLINNLAVKKKSFDLSTSFDCVPQNFLTSRWETIETVKSTWPLECLVSSSHEVCHANTPAVGLSLLKIRHNQSHQTEDYRRQYEIIKCSWTEINEDENKGKPAYGVKGVIKLLSMNSAFFIIQKSHEVNDICFVWGPLHNFEPLRSSLHSGQMYSEMWRVLKTSCITVW